ncbi:hypothetical protein TNCV_5062261 [Trichonephila clavipes]|nr:hypothetical protein TNCV_5062261 [Trichonephila clavipes]
MYKNALKEDLIRVVEELDGIVESTDTIVKLKTKIENSSTFESDPDFVKTLIQNCIDERVSQNERERMVEVKPINISLNQHSPSLSVRTAISPTLTEEFIIHPSVYSEIEKLGHAKSDVLLSESGSSLSADLGAHAYAYSSAISFQMFLFQIFSSGLHGNTAADSVQSEWPLWHAAKSNAVFARRRSELELKLELVKEKQKLLDMGERKEKNAIGARAGVTF